MQLFIRGIIILISILLPISGIELYQETPDIKPICQDKIINATSAVQLLPSPSLRGQSFETKDQSGKLLDQAMQIDTTLQLN